MDFKKAAKETCLWLAGMSVVVIGGSFLLDTSVGKDFVSHPFMNAAILVGALVSGTVLGYGCLYAKGKWDKLFNEHPKSPAPTASSTPPIIKPPKTKSEPRPS
ncbi:MAG: hypothetical protein WC612_04035 [Bdellovibrionales bacterium]